MRNPTPQSRRSRIPTPIPRPLAALGINTTAEALVEAIATISNAVAAYPELLGAIRRTISDVLGSHYDSS